MSNSAAPHRAPSTTARRTWPKIRAVVHAWLLLDFFGEARRTGGQASSLTTTIFSQSFLALVVAALIFPEPPPVPFAAANLSLSTLLVSLGAFDSEPPLRRRLADRVLLGTAPVGAAAVVTARVLHGAFATVLLTIGMALPPAVMLACRQHEAWIAPAYLVLACCCTGLAIGLLAVVLRAVRRFAGAHRAALAAGTMKALLLAGGIMLFALSLPALRQTADALPIGRIGASLLPQYHAAKLLAMPATESWRALALAGMGLVLLLAAALLGDDTAVRTGRSGREGPLLRLHGRCARTRPERAIAAFTATMLWRSPGVRSRILPLLGVPAAIALLALRGSDDRGRTMFLTMALQFPAIYLPFVIAMLTHADQPGTRWLFDSGPPLGSELVRRGVWLALLTHLLLPVHLIALPVLLATGVSPMVAVPASVFAFGAGGLVTQAMVRDLRDLPFCRDGDGGAAADLGNAVAYGILLAGLGAGAALAPKPWPAALAILSLALLLVQVLRRPAPQRIAAAAASPTLADLEAARRHAPIGDAAADPEPMHGKPSDRAADGTTEVMIDGRPGVDDANAGTGSRRPRAATSDSLRRELVAVGVLYACLSVVPLGLGLALAPS